MITATLYGTVNEKPERFETLEDAIGYHLSTAFSSPLADLLQTAILFVEDGRLVATMRYDHLGHALVEKIGLGFQQVYERRDYPNHGKDAYQAVRVA